MQRPKRKAATKPIATTAKPQPKKRRVSIYRILGRSKDDHYDFLLNDDVLCHIFSYVGCQELLRRVCFVCRDWARIVFSSALWRETPLLLSCRVMISAKRYNAGMLLKILSRVYFRTLRVLEIDHVAISGRTLHRVAEKVPKLEKLIVLDVSNAYIFTASDLADVMKLWPHMRSVVVAELTDVANLRKAFSGDGSAAASRLRELRIHEIGHWVSSIGDALSVFRNLESLMIDSIGIVVQNHRLEILAENCIQLRVLRMAGSAVNACFSDRPFPYFGELKILQLRQSGTLHAVQWEKWAHDVAQLVDNVPKLRILDMHFRYEDDENKSGAVILNLFRLLRQRNVLARLPTPAKAIRTIAISHLPLFENYLGKHSSSEGEDSCVCEIHVRLHMVMMRFEQTCYVSMGSGEYTLNMVSKADDLIRAYRLRDACKNKLKLKDSRKQLLDYIEEVYTMWPLRWDSPLRPWWKYFA